MRKTGKFEVGFAPPGVVHGLLRASLVWQESKKVGGIWIGGRGASEGGHSQCEFHTELMTSLWKVLDSYFFFSFQRYGEL